MEYNNIMGGPSTSNEQTVQKGNKTEIITNSSTIPTYLKLKSLQ